MLSHRSSSSTALAILLLICVLALAGGAQTDPPTNSARNPKSDALKSTKKIRLKVSDNGRYLVDQDGAPFLIAGESPQALMVNLSEKDAELFFVNRRAHGFNTVWINLLCRPGTGGRPNGSTYDGLVPFKTPDDFAMPNEAYFARCDQMIRLAEKHELLVILDPCETIDHLKPMLKNGPQKCRDFGRYLGSRYKDFDNILWLHGNDFQSWKNRDDDAVVQAVAQGDQGQGHGPFAHGRIELQRKRIAGRPKLGPAH